MGNEGFRDERVSKSEGCFADVVGLNRLISTFDFCQSNEAVSYRSSRRIFAVITL